MATRPFYPLDGDKIVIDLGGFDLTVGNGTDDVLGIYVTRNHAIKKITNGRILSEKNFSGMGADADYGSSLFIDSSITIGANGKGFQIGIGAGANGSVDAKGALIQYCVYGFNIQSNGYVFAINSKIENNSLGIFVVIGGKVYIQGASFANNGCNTNLASATSNTEGSNIYPF